MADFEETLLKPSPKFLPKLVCKLHRGGVLGPRLKILGNGLRSRDSVAVQLGGDLHVEGALEWLSAVVDEHPVCTPVVLHVLERGATRLKLSHARSHNTVSKQEYMSL